MTDDDTPADTDIQDDVPENIDQLMTELAEWREKALRAAAEAENTRRRAEREANDARAFAIQRFGKDLLEAADNLERALTASAQGSADPAMKNLLLGIEMTEKDLQSAFERNGLKKLKPAKGEKFDPHLHQAVMEQEDLEADPGTVSQTMQAGYELFGRVLRPAMVIVSAKRAGASGDSYPAAGGAAAGASIDTKA